MDYGKKRKYFKHRVKTSLHLKEGDNHEGIIQSTSNVEQFDTRDFECSIDTWMTPNDIVFVFSVTYHIICSKRTNYILTY
jgi:hypothetical protein